MTRRYFASEPITESTVTLRDEEAHHLLHVLRAAPGTQVTLFDGTGAEFDAEVVACGRSTVELSVLEGREVSRELPFALTLGVALPKGDRQRWLVEKAVELGVARLVPLRTERSQATGERPSDKLGRYVVEASKQCGRNRLMQIEPLHDWETWLRLPTGSDPDPAAPPRLWVADPCGLPISSDVCDDQRSAFIAIGPEGGLTDEENAAANAAGWQSVSLGPRILRVETAAIAIVAILALGRSG
jgi:16S rRNA (uracil1498-N3)-methyltransferase